MAQLKDTNIDGDLNVSGTIAGGGYNQSLFFS